MNHQKPEIPASSRLFRLLSQVDGITDGTGLSEKDAEFAIRGFIMKLKAESEERAERRCLCCGVNESEWIVNSDLQHLYIDVHLCQTCDTLMVWSHESIQRLETVIAYLRLVEKQESDETLPNTTTD